MYNLALTLILGIGACTTDGDWCPDNPAKLAFEQTIVKKESHSLNLSLEHMSDISDGGLRNRNGDRGLEVLMIEYRYDIGMDSIW